MIFDFKPADGPACPQCGCRDSEILRPPSATEGESWFRRMQGSGLARCGHCRLVFGFHGKAPATIAPAVADAALGDMEFEAADIAPGEIEPIARDAAYPVRQCPECGSSEIKVTSSGKKPANGSPRIRYHQCLACSANFKSIDSRNLR